MTRSPDEKLTETRRKLAEAAERLRVLRDGLAERGERPQVGDLFLFPGAALLPFRWAVLRRRPDRPLWYVTPADTAPFVGSADVAIDEARPGGPAVLRCALGLWVEEKELLPRRRTAFLEPAAVERAVAKIDEVEQCRLTGTAAQRETDASPAYDEWLDEASAAVEALRVMRYERRRTLSLRQAAGVLRLHTPPAAAAPLAAAPGLLPAAADEAELRGVDVPCPCAGRLLLVLQDGGVGVRYLAANAETPPTLAEVRPDGGSVPVAWKHTPDRGVCWAEVGWTEGRAVLRLGDGEDSQEITVVP